MLVLSARDVQALLDLDRLVDALAEAMADLSAGRACVPARVAAPVPERQAFLAAMPAYLPSAQALTTKLVSVFPGNREQPTHQAVVCCFDPQTGAPTAVMDGTFLTAARTAAGSALATRLLARSGSQVVVVVGTGVQARAHAVALSRAGDVMLRIAGRDPARAAALAADLDCELPVTVEAVVDVEEAVRQADVVCLATHAADPVVRRSWLRPGVHVNSVGYNTTGTGELDAETLHDAVVVVEERAAALAPPPAGAVELRRAVDLGLLDPDGVVEVGELVLGRRAGRDSDEQITVYKSVGVAAQDAAAAALVLAAATAQGAGLVVEL